MEGIQISDNSDINIENALMKQQEKQEEESQQTSSTNDNVSINDGDSQIINNITEDDFEEFKENAISYFTIDDEIKTLNKKLRELRKQKSDCTKNLLEFMGDNKIKDINTNSGKLKYVVTSQKERMNNKYIKKKLLSYFNSNDKALECFKFIDNREKVDIAKLKRVKS